MNRSISVRTEVWPSVIPFRIANLTDYDFPLVVCEIEQNGITGRGEGLGIYFLDETPESMTAQIQAIDKDLSEGADRQRLLELLPAGGARFAVDSALWDLEAQRTGVSAWATAGVDESPVATMFTIGLEDEPDEMAAKAAAAIDYPLLKIKLDAHRPVERVTAIRNVRPDARIIVDVNGDWNFDELCSYAPRLHALDVQLIEQPLARNNDAALESFETPIALCADESCIYIQDLEVAARRYAMINIKLDKTGGLTHALEIARAAHAKGVRTMAGSMGGTSLSMAPTHVLAKFCEFTDIDGPLLIGKDRSDGLVYAGGMVSLPARPFWGKPH